MNFDEYETAAMSTAGPAALKTEALQLSALGLCGESGEFADIVKKYIYHKHSISSDMLEEELGNILWYIARACRALDVSLEYIARDNLRKLRKRYPDGFASERSINRPSVESLPIAAATCPDCGVKAGEIHFCSSAKR